MKGSAVAAEDRFGSSVALSGDGNTLAIGIPHADGGAVEMYTRDTGDNWTFQMRVLNSAGAQFGHAVALSEDGRILAVGAPGDNSDKGAAYVYSGSSWGDTDVFEETNSGQFGSSVALNRDGTMLAVGAPKEKEGKGAAHVYTFDTAWGEGTQLSIEPAEANDQFGSKVSLDADGQILAVSAPWKDHSDAVNSGAVYAYRRDTTDKWGDPIRVDHPAVANQRMGEALALSSDGKRLAMGSNQDAIAVHIFTYNGAAWDIETITAPNQGSTDRFGTSLAFSANGGRLLVGADGETSSTTGVGGEPNLGTQKDSGAAYTFISGGGDGSPWTEESFIKASNTGASDSFGWSVAMDYNGDSFVIGAPGEDGNGNDGQSNNDTANSGAAYIFEGSSGTGG